MKTDELITLLVADGPKPAIDMRRNILLTSMAGALVAAILLAFLVGIRGDFSEALGEWRFVAKFIVMALLMASAARAVLDLSRPTTDPRRAIGLLAVPASFLALLLAVEMMMRPMAHWPSYAWGTNATICLSTVPLLAAAPLAALLFALRSSAPRSPTALGAIAGALAGGIGAFFYAAHCTDDSPMFVALWYSIAILIVSAVGALAGRRLLKW